MWIHFRIPKLQITQFKQTISIMSMYPSIKIVFFAELTLNFAIQTLTLFAWDFRENVAAKHLDNSSCHTQLETSNILPENVKPPCQ